MSWPTTATNTNTITNTNAQIEIHSFCRRYKPFYCKPRELQLQKKSTHVFFLNYNNFSGFHKLQQSEVWKVNKTVTFLSFENYCFECVLNDKIHIKLTFPITNHWYPSWYRSQLVLTVIKYQCFLELTQTSHENPICVYLVAAF